MESNDHIGDAFFLVVGLRGVWLYNPGDFRCLMAIVLEQVVLAECSKCAMLRLFSNICQECRTIDNGTEEFYWIIILRRKISWEKYLAKFLQTINIILAKILLTTEKYFANS